MVKKAVIFFIAALLISPYGLLIQKISGLHINSTELTVAVKNTLLQTLLSIATVMLFGFWSALGLVYLKNSKHIKKLKYFELCCLIPSFLPSLFFVAAVLQIIKPFPFGLAGIILVHTLMYCGFAALFFQTTLENKFQHISEQAYIEGASKTQLIKAILKNMPTELFTIFIFLFIQFFTSFSVPLLVGMQSFTVETLIYEKVRATGLLSEAMTIGFLESLFIMFLLLFFRAKSSVLTSVNKTLKVLGSPSGLIFIVLPVLIFFVGTFMGSIFGLFQFSASEWQNIIPLISKSIFLSLSTGLVLMLFLSLTAYAYGNKIFDKFLMSFIPLSTVLIGLGLLVVDFKLGYIEADIKFLLAMVVLFLPTLYRFQLKSQLQSLESQIEVARLMGAKDFFIFRKIIFPQTASSILFLSGLGAFWAIGDFAISQIIYGKSVTLALQIQSLLGAYRLEFANLLVLLLLLLGTLIFIMFKEMKYVVSQKN